MSLTIINHANVDIQATFKDNDTELRPSVTIFDSSEQNIDFDPDIYTNFITLDFEGPYLGFVQPKSQSIVYDPALTSIVLVKLNQNKDALLVERIHDEKSDLLLPVLQDEFDEVQAEVGYNQVYSTSQDQVKGGQTIEVDVNKHIIGYSESEILEEARELARQFSQEKNFEQALVKYKQLGGVRFLWGFFALCNRNSYESGYNKKFVRTDKHSHPIQKKFYERLATKLEKDLEISGHLKITAKASVPPYGYVFVEIMKLKTKWGTRKIISGTNPRIADYAGRTLGEVDGNLNVS